MNIKEFMYKFFSTRGRVARFSYTIYTVIIVFLGTFFRLGTLMKYQF